MNIIFILLSKLIKAGHDDASCTIVNVDWLLTVCMSLHTMDHEVITMLANEVQHASLDALIQLSSMLFHNRLPHKYLDMLNDEDKLDALRACLIISFITQGCIILRVFQLQASLEMLHRRDCVVIARTGSGKTL